MRIKECKSCKKVAITYQQGKCKSCLEKVFDKLKLHGVINKIRSLKDEKV